MPSADRVNGCFLCLLYRSLGLAQARTFSRCCISGGRAAHWRGQGRQAQLLSRLQEAAFLGLLSGTLLAHQSPGTDIRAPPLPGPLAAWWACIPFPWCPSSSGLQSSALSPHLPQAEQIIRNSGWWGFDFLISGYPTSLPGLPFPLDPALPLLPSHEVASPSSPMSLEAGDYHFSSPKVAQGSKPRISRAGGPRAEPRRWPPR